MTKQNPKTNTYYWRAVRRLAKRHGISITRARKLNWKKEANAERKRRSEARILSLQRKRPRSVPRKPTIPKLAKKVPTRGHKRELELREYDRIPTLGEEEFEDAEEYQETWEADWEAEWEELNDLDDLEGFLVDFEYEDSDKYKEPA
jgi:hypothetical protein